MTDDAGGLDDTEPRRRSGLGSSPLSRVMPAPKRYFDDILAATDAWIRDHGGALRVVERRAAAPVVREPEPVVEVPAVEAGPAEAAPPPEPVVDPTPSGPLSTSDLLARLKAMKLG